MCVNVCACTCVRARVSQSVCLHVCVSICMYVSECVCVCVCRHVCVCVCAFVSTYMYECVSHPPSHQELITEPIYTPSRRRLEVLINDHALRRPGPSNPPHSLAPRAPLDCLSATLYPVTPEPSYPCHALSCLSSLPLLFAMCVLRAAPWPLRAPLLAPTPL